MSFLIRAAEPDDAAEISRLAAELGYDASPEDVTDRLLALAAEDRFLVMVAASGEGSLLGWVGGERRVTLESGTMWEVTGLVVDSRGRRQGVGRALVRTVEIWARSQGGESVRVRSNVLRAESHHFYEGNGYARIKTQHAYMKRIAPE